jgi:hypothetical protein
LDVLSALQDSLHEGSLLKVTYRPAGMPSQEKHIFPKSISDSHIRAFDLATGTETTFEIRLLDIDGDSHSDSGMLSEMSNLKLAERRLPIGEFLAPHLELLHNMGWHTELSEDELSLHPFLKSGKPKKAADVRIVYSYFTVTIAIDSNGEITDEPVRSSRPYKVESKSFSTPRSYSKLSSAISTFFEEARKRSSRNSDEESTAHTTGTTMQIGSMRDLESQDTSAIIPIDDSRTTIVFHVQGSQPEPYEVVFERLSSQNLRAMCNCQAGDFGIICKHRINILEGNKQGIVSSNKSDVQIVQSWLPGTDVSRALLELRFLEAEAERLKKEIAAAKKRLAATFAD